MARAKKAVQNSIGAALQGKALPWLFVSESDVATVTSAAVTARDAVKLAVNRTLDSIRASIAKKGGTVADALKGNAKSNPTGLRAELGRFAGQCFNPETGYALSVARNYASGMVAALEFNMPWEPDSANKGSALRKEAREKAGKGSSKAKSAGKVSRTSWASTLKTAQRLMEQLSLMQATKARQESARKLAEWIESQDSE